MPNGPIHLEATNKMWRVAILISALSAFISWQVSMWVIYWFWLARYDKITLLRIQ